MFSLPSMAKKKRVGRRLVARAEAERSEVDLGPVSKIDSIEGSEKQLVLTETGLTDEDEESWKSAVICMVLGANVPAVVFEGFLRRIWGHLGIVKIARMTKGLTMVKFNDEAMQDDVLENGMIQFDRKPVIVRPQSSDLNMVRLVKSVALWIRLHNLGLQYWGKKYKLVEQEIDYEWLPVKCKHCGGFGHIMAQCRKLEKPKEVVKEKKINVDGEDVSAEPVKTSGMHQSSQPVLGEWQAPKTQNLRGSGSTKKVSDNLEKVLRNSFDILIGKQEEEAGEERLIFTCC
uniref:DUF4283 domain-containing protein n=1 Tax=Cannabis sativa TaxID=3483 RepID=A0A803QHW8_CANSA